MSSKLRSLYICYYPLTEPLVQTQVVAYLRGLARLGHTIHLLTFETEPLTPAQRRAFDKQLREDGIHWHWLRYHKRPSLPATLYDVMCGTLLALRLVRRYKLQAVHARSHVPATMGLLVRRLTGCKLLFDIRGLMAEEYVDAGNWTIEGLPYRITKFMERKLIAAADGIVVLTERIRGELFAADDARVHVIPCCTDLDSVARQSGDRDARRAELGLDGKNVLIYVGKFGGWYMEREMADFYAAARAAIPSLHFLILTQSDPALITNELARHGIAACDYTVRKVPHGEVGSYLAAADCAISFIRACPSKRASSPTKFGEYLAAGLPVVCNTGVGDVDLIVDRYRIGVSLNEFSPEAYSIAAEQLLPMLGDRELAALCRRVAIECASLEGIGIPRYDALYGQLAELQP